MSKVTTKAGNTETKLSRLQKQILLCIWKYRNVSEDKGPPIWIYWSPEFWSSFSRGRELAELAYGPKNGENQMTVLSRSLRRLEARGLVVRDGGSGWPGGGRRTWRVRLTERGEDVALMLINGQQTS